MCSVAIANARRLAGEGRVDGDEIANLIAEYGIASAAGVGGATARYSPGEKSVGNMKQFLNEEGFGVALDKVVWKTSKMHQGQAVYKVMSNVGDFIRSGDQLYLDGLHKDHIEVFDRRGGFKFVLNMDGTMNADKTIAGQGRRIGK